jgi:hypothetical protein
MESPVTRAPGGERGAWLAWLPTKIVPVAVAPAASEMTSQGTASGRFTRAIQRGHLFAAEMAAREMGSLSLSDALALCLLYEREQDPATKRRFGVGLAASGYSTGYATNRSSSYGLRPARSSWRTIRSAAAFTART